MRSALLLLPSLILLGSCSHLPRISEDSDTRLTGRLEIIVDTLPNPPWKGGDLQIFIDFDNETWWQEWWVQEGLDPQPIIYTLDGKALEMTLTVEGSVDMNPFPSVHGAFLISMIGKFKGIIKSADRLIGPFTGTGTGTELIRNVSYFGPIRYQTERTIWSGRVTGYPHDGENRIDTIHFINP